MYKYLILLLILLLILYAIPLNSFAQKRYDEEKAIKVVEALPEVKTLIKNCKNQQSRIAIWVQQYPTKSFKYFYLKVGVNSELMFNTIYHFYVTQSTYEVYYFDTAQDSILTLKQWRNLSAKN